MTQVRTKYPNTHPFRFEFPSTENNVRAYSQAGDLSVPNQVTGLTANVVNGDDVQISFNPVSVPAHPGARPVTGIEIEVSFDAGPFTSLVNLSGSVTSYDDLSKAIGSYTYRATATNSVGDSSVSATAEAVVSAVATEPGQVTGLVVTPGANQNTLTWSVPSDGGSSITDYIIEVDQGGGYIVISDGVSATTGYVDTGLSNGIQYTYRVAAANSVGTGTVSSPVSGTPVSVPSQVTGLSVTPGDTQNTLFWTAPNNQGSPVTDYVIEVDSGSGFTTISDGVSTATSFTHTGLINGTLYTYRVSAVNGEGTGQVSSTSSGTPSTATPPQTRMATSQSTTTRRAYSTGVSFYDSQVGGNLVNVKVGEDKTNRAVIYSDTDSPATFWMEFDTLSTQDGDNRWVNGVMLNPNVFGGASQGWNERMGIVGGQTGAPLSYDDSLNINKGRIQINRGDEGCYVFAVANPSPSSQHGNTVLEYIDFTVMASVPAEDFYRAPAIYSDKTPLFFASDKDTSCFANLTKPASQFINSVDLDHPHFLPEIAAAEENGEQRNRLTPGNDTYSREWIEYRSAPLLYMHYDDADPAEFDSWTDEYIIHGLDLHGAIEVTGWVGSSGAGQSFGRGIYIFPTAYMLNSQAVLDNAMFHSSQDILNTNQLYTVDDTKTLLNSEKINSWPNANGSRPIEFRREHEGQIVLEGDGEGAALGNRYAGLLYGGYIRTGLALQLLEGGPANKTLNQYLLEIDGNTTADKTNPNYRLHGGLYISYSQKRSAPYPITGTTEAHWEAWNSNLFYPPYTDQVPFTPAVQPSSYTGSDTPFVVTGNADGFSYGGNRYQEGLSLTPLTRMDVAYSIDGKQRVVVSDTALTGQTINLPCRCETFVSMRFANATGDGVWSGMRPAVGTGGVKTPIVVKTGTEANSAPTFAANPAILEKNVHNFWPGNSYIESNDLSETVTVYAGAGFPTGFPAPVWPDDYTVEPVLDGVVQTALASADDGYELPSSTSVQTIAFDVTVTNSQGSVTQRTNTLNIPASVALPTGTIVDFTGAPSERRNQAFFFENFGGNMQNGGSFDPLVRVVEGATNQLGVITFDNEGGPGSPRAFLRSPVPLTGGTSYTFNYSFLAYGGGTTDIDVWLENNSGGADLTAKTNFTTTSSVNTGSFVYTPSSDTDVRLVINLITGGSAGGSFRLLSYSVRET